MGTANIAFDMGDKGTDARQDLRRIPPLTGNQCPAAISAFALLLTPGPFGFSMLN